MESRPLWLATSPLLQPEPTTYRHHTKHNLCQLDHQNPYRTRIVYPGSHFFNVIVLSCGLSMPTDLKIAFNHAGMWVFDMDYNKKHSFGYADIYRWGGSSSQFSLIIWNTASESTFELKLATAQAAGNHTLIQSHPSSNAHTRRYLRYIPTPVTTNIQLFSTLQPLSDMAGIILDYINAIMQATQQE